MLGVVLVLGGMVMRVRLALGVICGVDVGERVGGHLALLRRVVGWVEGRRREVQKREVGDGCALSFAGDGRRGG
ncbi:hypothetical protein QBC39DRAFT_354457 [Podospora conica]|nr:hypothetical protein QBC39DRAFT_354457 [Schizothecium conicum]